MKAVCYGRPFSFRKEGLTYGNQIWKNSLDYLSAQLATEFRKGFNKSNLRKMRQFYRTFPIRDTLCLELSWSHYRLLMRVPDE